MDKMKNKILLCMFFGILLIGNVFALDNLGTFKQNDNVRVTQICNDATYITLSSISYPNSTTAIEQINMTSLGSGEFYYIFTNTSTIGRYDVRGVSDGCGKIFATYFEITPSGENLTTSKGLIYFLVTLFAFSIFGILIWLFLNINGNNPKDETGYLGINYRKYVKTALFPLVYISFIWFFNFIIGLSNNYLGLTLYSDTLGFIFLVLMKLVLPVIIITAIIELVLMVKDSNIKKEYASLWSRY